MTLFVPGRLTLRAFAIAEPGSAPAFLDLDVPEPAAGEVRVRVQAASVNGFEPAVVHGFFTGIFEHRYPLVLGKDFAGTVDAVGPDVTEYAVGDRVFGVVTKPHLGDGSFGEYVTVPVAVGLAKLPDSVDFTDGAALGLAGAAALSAFDGAALESSQTILISGATGGVGNQAVQLAAGAGAHVIATAHTDEEQAAVRALGASEFVDYTGDVAAAVRDAHPEGVDAVIHLAGDPTALLPLVRDGGRFVSTLLVTPDQLSSDRVTVVPVYADPTPAVLARLLDNRTGASTTVPVQRIYPLGDVAAAMAAFGAGTIGKVVISVP